MALARPNKSNQNPRWVITLMEEHIVIYSLLLSKGSHIKVNHQLVDVKQLLEKRGTCTLQWEIIILLQ